MQQLEVACVKNSSGHCKIRFPSTMQAKAHIYFSEMTSASPSTCVTPLLGIPAETGAIGDGFVEVSVEFSNLQALGLVDKALAICWIQQEEPFGGTIPSWAGSFLGNLIFVDGKESSNVLYAGLLAKIRIAVVGMAASQVSADSLPAFLRQLYLRDTDKCGLSPSTTSVPLFAQTVETSKGTPKPQQPC